MATIETPNRSEWAAIDVARELAADFERDALESERLRRPTEHVVGRIRDSGLLEMFVPRRFGGLELDLDAFCEVAISLGEADASLAWVTNFYIEHNWWFAHFPKSLQERVFTRGGVLAPGVIAPSGRLTRSAGGYRLSGRWQWASGASHADWALVSALPEGAASLADALILAVPRESFRAEDTWFTDGLRATASGDIVVDDASIAEDQTIPFRTLLDGTARGSELDDGAIYRTPAIAILLLAASLPALGQARIACRRFREAGPARQRFGDGARQAELPAYQMRLAAAELDVNAAELLARQVVNEAMERRGDASVEMRSRWSCSLTEVVHRCRHVLASLLAASGGAAHRDDHPLQRSVRDVSTLCAHAAFNEDAQRENLGRVLFDLAPSSPFV